MTIQAVPDQLLLYESETSKHRDVLAPFCSGYGIDLGFGGDPITPATVRMDFPRPYARTGDLPVQLGGDCRDLYWFRDGVLDFVYSSHVLEDFDERETGRVMKEWVRVLRAGGKLVLLLPDQQRYVEHCRQMGQPGNAHHSIAHFSISYVVEVANRLGNVEVFASFPELGAYSFGLVLERTAAGDELTAISDLRKDYAATLLERDELKVSLRESEMKTDRLQAESDRVQNELRRFHNRSFMERVKDTLHARLRRSRR